MWYVASYLETYYFFILYFCPIIYSIFISSFFPVFSKFLWVAVVMVCDARDCDHYFANERTKNADMIRRADVEVSWKPLLPVSSKLQRESHRSTCLVFGNVRTNTRSHSFAFACNFIECSKSNMKYAFYLILYDSGWCGQSENQWDIS